MAAIVYEQFQVFLHSFLCGFLLWFLYDALLILRRTWHHGAVLVAVEDILFWMVAAGMIFSMLYTYNYGSVRGYAVFGVFVGILLHGSCVTGAFLGIYGWILEHIKKCIQKLIKNMSKMRKKD